MLKHVVLLQFKADYEEQKLQALVGQLNALPDQVPQILSFVHGPDAGVTESKFDYGVVAEFASKEDCLAYLAHPAHQAVNAAVRELLADAAHLQFEY